MYHNCDTTNFPWVVVVVGGGIRELEYLIIYYEKKYFFLSSTMYFINFNETTHKRSYLKCLAGKRLWFS
jgi:hypothetical protein